MKFLRPDVAGTGEHRARFEARFAAEGRMLRQLSSATAGIVQAHDLGVAVSPRGEATPYIVMEWIEGTTLAEELRRRPTRSAKAALELLAPVLDALAAAHELGVAHRDVKPANLMLCESAGKPTMKILDFGIAQVIGAEQGPTFAGSGASGMTRVFSVAYAAPEQFDPSIGRTGPWTDVYAFGLLLIEVIDGRAPYSRDDRACDEALDPDVRPTLRSDRSLDKIMRYVTAVDPANRPQSAGELRARLASSRRGVERAAAGALDPGPATPRIGPDLILKPRSRRWAILSLVAFTVAALCAFATYLALFSTAATRDISDEGQRLIPLGAPSITIPLARWQDAENSHDTKPLASLYAEHVCFYHADLSNSECLAKLHGLYAASPKFAQSIDPGSVRIVPRASGRTRVEFDKTYSTGGHSNVTRAYLVFDENMKIVVEGDERTDQAMSKIEAGTHARCVGAEKW